jgi:caffeoyl-CoA O-methyltransferase
MLGRMARMKTQVTQELADYVAGHARQDDVLARVERETAELPNAQMATTRDEAALLTMLARLVGARRALEIGTFTGYGAISIARGLAEGGSLTCLEVSEEYAGIARRNVEAAGLSDRVEIRVGPADEALRTMPEEPTFDFVFIDADKQAYPTYYDLVLPRLLPGGLLLLDNVFLGGAVVTPSDDRTRIMHELNDRVTADERVDSVMVHVADGLTLVRKR